MNLKLGEMTYTYNLITKQAKARELLRVQGQPGLHSNLKASLCQNVKSHLDRKRKRQKGKIEKIQYKQKVD